VVSSQLMATEPIAELLDDDTSFMYFIEDSIKLLLRSNRPFLICSKKDVPPIVIQIHEGRILVALLSELQGI
jgi:hypothetical protein